MRKKENKKRLNSWRCTQGVVSIFLAIVMLPLASVALGISEYFRYQSTAETAREVSTLSSMSTLGNYDEYLEERFALLAVSQETDINETYGEYLTDNLGILGNAVSINGDSSAYGVYPFSNTESEVLFQQIMDFSESTGAVDFVMSDLNLEELISKLSTLSGLTKVEEAMDDLADLVDKIETLVEKLKTVKETLESIQENYTAIISDSDELAASVKNLIESMHDRLSSADLSDVDALESFAVDYIDDIKDIYTGVKSIYTEANSIKTSVNNLPDQIDAVVSAFNNAKNALSDAEDSSSTAIESVSGEEAAASSTSIYKQFLESIESTVTDSLSSLKSGITDTVKSTLSSCVDDIKDSIGLTELKTVFDYYDNENGLTESGKQAIVENILTPLASEITDDWDTLTVQSLSETAWDGFKSLIKIDTIVSKIQSFNLSNTISTITSALATNLQSAIQDAGISFIVNLVNIIKGFFDLSVFYDADLDAYIIECDGYQATNSPYQTFLTALGSFLTASEEFTDGIKDLDFLEILDSAKTFYTAVKQMCTSIRQITESLIAKIQDMASWFSSGGVDFYQDLLLACYMTKMLPNRTNDKGYEYNSNGESVLKLSGTALNGYSYNDIVRPTLSGASPIMSATGISGLNTFFNSLTSGGSDEMFKGAELEYILAGSTSEYMNQTVVFMQLYFLRMLCNLPTILTSTSVGEMAAAANIACWAVYLLEILAEPFVDTVLLVNGSENEYLFKNFVYLTPGGVDNLLENLADAITSNEALQNEIKGLNSSGANKVQMSGLLKANYQTQLLFVMLLTATRDDILLRFQNLIQLESAAYYKSKNQSSFSIDKTYTAIQSNTVLNLHTTINVFNFTDALHLRLHDCISY